LAIAEGEAEFVEPEEAAAVVEVELVEELDPSTPLAASALKIAPTSPPPDGGAELALNCESLEVSEVFDAP